MRGLSYIGVGCTSNRPTYWLHLSLSGLLPGAATLRVKRVEFQDHRTNGLYNDQKTTFEENLAAWQLKLLSRRTEANIL